MTENKSKQTDLNGIDRITKHVSLTDAFHDASSRDGLKSIADYMSVDISTVSNFKNAKGGLTLPQIEKFLDASGYILVPRLRYKRIVGAYITATELVKEAIGWKS